VLILEAQDPQQQERIGAALARLCPRPALIWLEGDLGAGKTTLARGLLHGLGYRGAVKSPTYTLVEPYEDQRCYHFDLYRLSDPEELEYIGLRDLLAGDPILLVEWPERGIGVLPAPDLKIHINHLADGRRLRFESQNRAFEPLLDELRKRLPENVKS